MIHLLPVAQQRHQVLHIRLRLLVIVVRAELAILLVHLVIGESVRRAELRVLLVERIDKLIVIQPHLGTELPILLPHLLGLLLQLRIRKLALLAQAGVLVAQVRAELPICLIQAGEAIRVVGVGKLALQSEVGTELAVSLIQPSSL